MLAVEFTISMADVQNKVIGLAALLIALGVIYRYILRPFLAGVKAFIERQHRIMNAVSFVETELRPNGGSSMRDAVDKIVRCTELMSQLTKEQNASVTSVQQS